MLSRKLEELQNQVIEMGRLVEKLLKTAFDIQQQRVDFANIENLESKINDYELKLEAESIKLIALYQPEASNLRLVVMILKMINDLERMGDLAFNIANSFKYLKKHNIEEIDGDIVLMKETTLQMIKNSLKAFVQKDEILAREIWQRDDFIDDLQKKVFKKIKRNKIRDEETEILSFNKNRIANAVERIADLATNIAEDIIYIKTGETIKHRGFE